MRGRKPGLKNVVSLVIGDGEAIGERHLQAARACAARLKKTQKGLDPAAAIIWDEDAPALCHPLHARLNERNVRQFRHYCEAVARYQAAAREWAAAGKIYSNDSKRSGTQIRQRPEFAQMNAFFSQALRLATVFGMTPVDERRLSDEGGFEAPGGDDFE